MSLLLQLRTAVASLNRWHPLRLLMLGYLSYIVVGWILLSLPVSWEVERISPIDNLFTATSAVTTTGLITVNTPDAYSFVGELIILLGFQLGGLGYMTLGSFVILMRTHDLPSVRENVGRVAFTLPDGFNLRLFLRHVVIFTGIAELAGAAGLYFAFRSAGLEDPFWPAIFHSVSAFCTAGFSVFPNSLENFHNDFWVNAIIGVLSIAGAIGFLVISDVWLTLTGRRESVTLTSRIILHFTFWAILIGWAIVFLVEPAVRELPADERLLVSGFQSITSLTTVGFNTFPIGQLHQATALVLIVLMIMGASPAGTGGGLKSTSVSAAFAVLWSVVRRRDHVTFWGKRVPVQRLFVAFAASVFYLFTLIIGATVLLLVDDHSFEDVIFEAASALGTVGLSRGITPALEPVGKIIIISLMFLGRLGPLTFGLAVMSGVAPTPGGEDVAV